MLDESYNSINTAPMKAPKQIKLDWNKLLAFRQQQAKRGTNSPDALSRLRSAMVGAKPGLKPVAPR
jgi:hypothetical protein